MTKFAILSDIHSNVFALKSVVNHAESLGADKFINLGDIFYGPIAPKETFDYLITKDFITISGNQDRFLHEVNEQDISANATLSFVLSQLGDAPIKWLKSLPFDLYLDDIYCCHASPDDDLCYLLEDVSLGTPQIRKDDTLVEVIKNISSPIILCGHSHLPNCVELSTGQLIINPGSIGLPAYTDEEPCLHSMQNYSAKASYCMLELSEGKTANVSFHKVEYPVQDAIDAALKQNRTDWAHYLMTGRKLPS